MGLVTLLALAGTAQAGGKHQGRDLQGLAYQSPKDRGSSARDGLVEGDRLIGSLVDQETRKTIVLEITSFGGDTVHATAHDLTAATSRSVRLHPEALTGLQWHSTVCAELPRCTLVMYRIVGVSPDSASNTMPGRASNHEVWLYEVELSEQSGPAPGDWTNVCDPRAGARGRGLFVNGRWNQDGSWNASGYTFSCPGGVIAKCVRDWGYKPWKSLVSAKHGSVSLLPLHLACIRAARADYCGDGTSHTRDGTLIDIADRYSFNVHEGIPGFQDEAVFGPDGARWVRAPRWPAGRPVKNGWLFATCARPSAEVHASAEKPLLSVQSKTSPGQPTPSRR